MKLLHLSDLHLQTDVSLDPFGPLDWRQLFARAEFVSQGRPALFRGAQDTIGRLLGEGSAQGADHLLITGDLTAIGMRGEFTRARSALAPFEGRLTVIPGNHDRTSARSSALFESVFGDLLHSALPELCAEGPYPFVHLLGEGAAIVGLDSARVPRIPGMARGRVGRPQLSALESILRDHRIAGRDVVLAVHHAPLRPDRRPDRWTHGLADAPDLLAIADAHRVSAICHGHIHHRFRVERAGKAPLFCAGSSTQLGREGYWIYELQAGGSPGGPVRATSRPPSAAER